MNRSRHISLAFKRALLLLCFTLLFTACDKKEPEPIKLGFLGGITGRFSRLGIDGRDGALLAVELANAKGGINGHRVELIIRDDKQNRDAALAGMTSLNEEKVAAVIGPFTSSMAVITTPLSDRYRLVTIGPTVSTNELFQRDDYFLRNYPDSKHQAKQLAEHIALNLKMKKLSVIFDQNNRAHCESWYQSLQKSFEQLGGQIVAINAFDSSERSSYYQMAKDLLKTPTEGIFILANSVDTVLISQQLTKLNNDNALFASEWSFTNDLLQMGGSTVEGMTIVHTYNPQGESENYLNFSASYESRFGRKPSFAAAHAFDATNLVLTGLSANPDPDLLKQTLLTIPEYQGLQNNIHLNRYGDSERELFLTTVQAGEFVLIQ